MKLIVKPRYERGRTFKDLVRAMQFAEDARKRQEPKQGAVEVHIYDGRSPHFLATYAKRPTSLNGVDTYSWVWAYAKGW